ncbi:MAG: autotransporter outer membrane beta-barrel domain-containing protein [Deltaproteobacteria bacterium]|nr:autotransporter outer membrane beta-barrel domain-containing protein [Deltaproteobacteria bacterium]
MDFFNRGETFWADSLDPIDDEQIETKTSPRDFTAEEKEAIFWAFEYFTEMLLPEGSPYTPAVMRLGIDLDENYNASALFFEDKESEIGRVYDALLLGESLSLEPSGVPGDSLVGAHALIVIDDYLFDTQKDSQLPETRTALTPTLIHELGHTFGITGENTSFHNNLRSDILIGDDLWGNSNPGDLMFIGETAVKVFGVPVPMAHESEQEDSHFGVRNGLMTHYQIVNYPMFMEVELAALEDIGFIFDRRAFFGLSLYATADRASSGSTFALSNKSAYEDFYANQGELNPSKTIINQVGFFQSLGLDSDANWLGYDYGVPNTKPYAVGVHFYGDGYTLTQKADLLAYGVGAAGIRVDGFDNTVHIPEGVRVSANGELGTGLLVSFGSGHLINSAGTIEATGELGIAARFDMGAPYVYEVLTSYGYYPNEYGDYLEIGGPLIKAFNLSGKLLGGPSSLDGQTLSDEEVNFHGRPIAIYIGPNVHVGEINILNGAEIQGDIISRWDPIDHFLDYSYSTSLTFGLKKNQLGEAIANTADPNFSLTYRGNITGPQSLNVKVEGGTLNYAGRVEALSFTLEAGSTLISSFVDGEPTTIIASSITISPYATVDFDPQPFTYGNVEDPWQIPFVTFESLDGSTVASPQMAASSGVFSIGAYDYTWEGLAFSLGTVKAQTSSRTVNHQRAATDIQNAPLAMLMSASWLDAAFTRLTTRSLDLVRKYELSGSEDSGANVADSAGSGELEERASVWISPSYLNSRHNGERTFKIRGYGVSAGLDYQITDSFLLGLALSLDFPRYESLDSDVDGRGTGVSLYGAIDLPGELELGLSASMGSMRFEGIRSVESEQYLSAFKSDIQGVGANLGRSFLVGEKTSLRPFAAFDYFHAERSAYSEKAGIYSLNYESTQNNIYRLRAGADANFNLNRAYINVRAYWQGLRGQTKEEPQAFFSEDPGRNKFSAPVEGLDRDSLGLAAGFGYRLGTRTEVSAKYSFVGGSETKSHEASVGLQLRF